VTLTKQIPAGTVAAPATNPGVLDENNVVDAAPAGPDPTASATTPTSVVAAPTPAPTMRSLTRDLPSSGTPARYQAPGPRARNGVRNASDLVVLQRHEGRLSRPPQGDGFGASCSGLRYPVNAATTWQLSVAGSKVMVT